MPKHFVPIAGPFLEVSFKYVLKPLRRLGYNGLM